MVLEEASSPIGGDSDTFSNDSGAISDHPGKDFNTPVTSVSTDADLGQLAPGVYPAGYRIPFDQLPHAVPYFGRAFGYSNAEQMQFIVQTSASSANALKRPLTKEECDAHAWHCSKAYMLSSLGYPIGLGGGLVRWYYTQQSMRFPFYQPDLEKYKFQTFGPLKDRAAYLCWQSVRLNTYGFIGGWIGKRFFATYALSVMLAGQINDTRLKDVQEALYSRRERERAQRASRANNQRQDSSPTASPTNPAYSDRSHSDDRNSYSPSANSLNYETQQADGWSQQEPSSPPARNNEALGLGYPMAQNRKTSTYDDASPMAPAEAQGPTSSDNASAWDRLRRGGSSPSTQRAAPPTNQQYTSAQANQSSDSGADPWGRLRGSLGPDKLEDDGAPLLDQLTDDDSKWR